MKLTHSNLLKRLKIDSNPSRLSNWINGKNIPLSKTQLKIIGFILKNSLDINELIIFGKKVRNSIEFNNEFLPLKTAVTKDYFKKDLIIKLNNKKYLNMPFLFPKFRNKKYIQFLLRNKEILTFYKYKYAHSLNPLLLPKYLEINKDFLVGLAIYLAEGSRNRHPKITNSEPTIIDQAIKFFKLFSFKNKDLRAWIQLHERSEKNFNQVKDFWIKNTNLNNKNITKVRIKKSVGNDKVKQYGTLHLEVNSILFQLLINNLLKFISRIVKRLSKEELVWFLQGLYAGEGSVNITKFDSVNMVRYTSLKKEERLMIKQILNKFRIESHNEDKRGDLSIFGYENIKKIYDLNIFEYHPIRKEKLEKGYDVLSKSHIPGFNKKRIINILKNKNNLTSSEVASSLNLGYWNAKKHLRELYNENKISKTAGSGPIPNKWFI